MEFSNKVKRTVALGEIKKKATEDIKKEKGNNQTWFEYFEMISLEELGHFNLLQDGSSSLNGSLHLKLIDLRVKILLQGN
jgi:hypothetical protein